MKQVDKYKERVDIQGEAGEQLTIEYDNRGEPYREGVTLSLTEGGGSYSYVSVFLERSEAEELKKVLLRLYPEFEQEVSNG